MREPNTAGGHRPLLVAAERLGVVVLLASLVACTVGDASNGGPSAPATSPRLSFKEQAHNAGQFSRTQQIEYHFAFTNTGHAPLQVGAIQAAPLDPVTCACEVTAAASTAPINPGDSGDVIVYFSSPMEGMKDVLLKVPSNDATQPEQTLTLSFQVLP